ncbi:MAG TPA: OmpA family protein [Terriglobales bacterium]|nr:OmpA family protein [Terriglobales bacterium]
MTTAALAAALAVSSLPLAAQSSAAPQTPATAPVASQAAPSATAPNADVQAPPPLAAPVKQGFWGRLNPFARKKYVQGQVAPIRDRVNELDGLTTDNSKSIADVDARSKAGIAAVGDTARQAGETADAAQQQVQQDSTQASQLNDRVGSVNTKLQGVDQYQLAQTAELDFKPGPATLSASTQQQLDGFLQGLDTQKGYVVEVTAYSTRKGQAGVAASQQLADAVVRYMVLQHNLPLYRIYTMGMGGMGNAAPTAAQMGSAPRNRRTVGGTVQIKILKNSLGS